jgi:hypothetical protein
MGDKIDKINLDNYFLQITPIVPPKAPVIRQINNLSIIIDKEEPESEKK